MSAAEPLTYLAEDAPTEDSLWPEENGPDALATIESVPLASRGLPESTYELLARAARKWPDRTAVTVLPDATRWRMSLSLSFSELLADVHRYANVLHALGVRRGDAVALIAPNCAELIPAILAAQLAGLAAPINGGLSRTHIVELLRGSGARVLIAAGPELDSGTWDRARELAVEGLLDAVLVLEPTAGRGESGPLPAIEGVRLGYLADLAAEQDSMSFAGIPPAAADLAGLFHTGGTTGMPKLAAHTHANEVANAWMIGSSSVLDDQAVIFGALPLFHVNALVVTVLSPLFRGQSVVWAGPLGYREPAFYAEFWNIVQHYRIAAMSAVPTVYAGLARCPVTVDISSLEFAMVGASPLPPAVRTAFESRTGVTLLEGYGLTESTCATVRNFADHPRAGAVGQRMPYQRVRVVRIEADGTWTDLPRGATGVLALAGPAVFAGYVIGRDERGHILDGLGTLVDGWLDTGDLAHIDSDDFVYLHGRAKDLIIRGGHNIDPAVIEDALLAHPQVTGAAAVGRPDAHAGEVPVAYVTVAPDCTLTGPELIVWAADRVPERAAVPRAITIVDALPVTDVGKPYKLALRADATRRELLEALADIPGVHAITAGVEDGSITATVEIDSAADQSGIEAVLGRYAFGWRTAVTRDGSEFLS